MKLKFYRKSSLEVFRIFWWAYIFYSAHGVTTISDYLEDTSLKPPSDGCKPLFSRVETISAPTQLVN
jgi:hypothetical protein